MEGRGGQRGRGRGSRGQKSFLKPLSQRPLHFVHLIPLQQLAERKLLCRGGGGERKQEDKGRKGSGRESGKGLWKRIVDCVHLLHIRPPAQLTLRKGDILQLGSVTPISLPYRSHPRRILPAISSSWPTSPWSYPGRTCVPSRTCRGGHACMGHVRKTPAEEERQRSCVAKGKWQPIPWLPRDGHQNLSSIGITMRLRK